VKQTQKIAATFLGVGYTRDRAGLPLEAVRVPVPQPAADQVLIRVAAPSLNPLEYKLADLNAGLESLKAGRGVVGKVAVIVDRALADVSELTPPRAPRTAASAIPSSRHRL
jgi:NADPH:quinone reductase-like Zn-dependent oxidoreductase